MHYVSTLRQDLQILAQPGGNLQIPVNAVTAIWRSSPGGSNLEIWTSILLRQDLQILAQTGGNLQIPVCYSPFSSAGKALLLNISKRNTPIVIAESAMLNTGSKKVK